MPRYFFDTSDGDTALEDEHGWDLDGREEVSRWALAGLGEMARDVLKRRDCRILSVTVRDEQNFVVFRAELTLNTKWT